MDQTFERLATNKLIQFKIHNPNSYQRKSFQGMLCVTHLPTPLWLQPCNQPHISGASSRCKDSQPVFANQAPVSAFNCRLELAVVAPLKVLSDRPSCRCLRQGAEWWRVEASIGSCGCTALLCRELL